MNTKSQPRAAGEHTLPASLRLIRTHPNAETRSQLLELVSHDHNEFGSEEALFFCAADGSDRARIAQTCVDRYNSHAALVAALEDLLWMVGPNNTNPKVVAARALVDAAK